MTGALHALGHLAAVVVRPITPASLLTQLAATRELDQAVRLASLLGRHP